MAFNQLETVNHNRLLVECSCSPLVLYFRWKLKGHANQSWMWDISHLICYSVFTGYSITLQSKRKLQLLDRCSLFRRSFIFPLQVFVFKRIDWIAFIFFYVIREFPKGKTSKMGMSCSSQLLVYGFYLGFSTFFE